MGALHLLSRSPGESQALSQCLDRTGQGDAVLLLEGGVYAALKNSGHASRLQEAMSDVALYALAPDLAARGITEAELVEGVVRVDYEGFVGLAISHGPVISWF